ncbi:MAG: hypothetical protein BroJett011_70750 [Chloroflexota bacterium]|nr:MAG: hypothetical protein BroJett011_70750 [Chloroflexota bacterium]
MGPVTTSFKNNPRQLYLLETLSLSHDPFAGPVAEQELHGSGDETKFFSYYVDPHSPDLNKPLPQLLREARNGFIFGQPGSGKTTLRYTLEAECRAVHDRTLVVTYELSHKIDQPLTDTEHWRNLASELAVDLFIQVIEQLETLPTPSEYQKQQFQTQLALIWPRLRRTVVRMVEDDFSTEANGLAALWPRLNRPITRYVAPSPKIINLINACLPVPELKSEALSGTDLLTAGIEAAKAWGFKQIFVLVDRVDAYEREVSGMLSLIAPLLENLADWQAQGLFFYFFLTAEMEMPVRQQYGDSLNKLSLPPLYHTIMWDKGRLTALLHQRLWAAGSRVPGFNALATSAWEDQLEDYLIQAAHQSPRRLLQVMSLLIDAHAQVEADQPLFTLEDWRRMQQQWSYGSPLPLDFGFNHSQQV